MHRSDRNRLRLVPLAPRPETPAERTARDDAVTVGLRPVRLPEYRGRHRRD